MNKKYLKCVTEANPLKCEWSYRTTWFGCRYFGVCRAFGLLSGDLPKHVSRCLCYLALCGPGAKGSVILEKMEEREIP